MKLKIFKSIFNLIFMVRWIPFKLLFHKISKPGWYSDVPKWGTLSNLVYMLILLHDYFVPKYIKHFISAFKILNFEEIFLFMILHKFLSCHKRRWQRTVQKQGICNYNTRILYPGYMYSCKYWCVNSQFSKVNLGNSQAKLCIFGEFPESEAKPKVYLFN